MTVTNPTYRTDANVVWCPGCGHFGVMGSLAKALKTLQIPNEHLAMVSGIGCSSRIPGYFDVFGFNTVHGRALPVAQGMKLARPDLTVITASGDGDALAIGAGHFMHAARRNVDLTLIIMDNQVYGLTKGQASPTSPTGDEMKLATYGVPETPLNPTALSINLGATFVAKGFTGDPKGLTNILLAAIKHRGFSVVHTLTPCVTFRGKWDPYRSIKEGKAAMPEDHDPRNADAALALARREDRFYFGVYYTSDSAPTFGDRLDDISTRAEPHANPSVEAVLQEFVP